MSVEPMKMKVRMAMMSHDETMTELRKRKETAMTRKTLMEQVIEAAKQAQQVWEENKADRTRLGMLSEKAKKAIGRAEEELRGSRLSKGGGKLEMLDDETFNKIVKKYYKKEPYDFTKKEEMTEEKKESPREARLRELEKEAKDVESTLHYIAYMNGSPDPDEDFEGFMEFINDNLEEYADAVVKHLKEKKKTMRWIADDATTMDEGFTMFDDLIREHADNKKAKAWFKSKGQ